MSKCSETYRKYLQEHPHTAVGFDHFAFIWNARGEVDKEICEAKQGLGPENGCCPTHWDDGLEEAIRVIEQEDEK